MLDFNPAPPSRCVVSDADRLAEPQAPWAMTIRWLETQRQDVWGQAILASSGDLSDPEGRVLLWMIGRKMDRANAIRLFWRLYRPELSLPPGDGDTPARPAEDDIALAALKAIIARFNVSGYPNGQLGLGRDEARYYRLRYRAGLAAAGDRRGRKSALEIPAAFFQPHPGRALEQAPTIRPVGPAPEWMGTETEDTYRICGERLRDLVSGPASRRFGAEMRARLRKERNESWIIRGAAGGITALAAMIYVSGGDMGTLLKFLHAPIG